MPFRCDTSLRHMPQVSIGATTLKSVRVISHMHFSPPNEVTSPSLSAGLALSRCDAHREWPGERKQLMGGNPRCHLCRPRFPPQNSPLSTGIPSGGTRLMDTQGGSDHPRTSSADRRCGAGMRNAMCCRCVTKAQLERHVASHDSSQDSPYTDVCTSANLSTSSCVFIHA